MGLPFYASLSKNSKLIKILDYSSFSSYNNSTADGKCTVNQLTYDSVGNLQGVTFVNQNNLQFGATVKDSYDRATQSNVVCNGKNIVNKVNAFKNFASNEVTSERAEVFNAADNTLHGSLTTGYSQDGLKRPLKTTIVNNSGKGYSTTYEYYDHLDENNDKVGTTPFIKSVTNKTVTNGVESSPQVALVEYDSAGNITKYGNNEYAYDGLNRLVTEHNADLNKSYTYEYDAGGNITKKTEYSYKNILQSGYLNQSNFVYDDALWKDKLTKVNSTNLSYDANGNITSFNGKNLAWSAYNKLSAITVGSHQVNFSYNANGTRYQKTTVNGTTTYYYANDKLISEKTGNNTIIHYLYNSSGIVGFAYKSNNQEAIYTYRKNLFGDIIGIYDANNTCVASYAYDAYGKCSILSATNTTIANANPFRYRGYYYDVETGLYYCNARYYSPELCRWISPDSTEYLDPKSIHGLNLYAYCKNNPIMYVDPTGNLAWWIIALIVAATLLKMAVDLWLIYQTVDKVVIPVAQELKIAIDYIEENGYIKINLSPENLDAQLSAAIKDTGISCDYPLIETGIYLDDEKKRLLYCNLVVFSAHAGINYQERRKKIGLAIGGSAISFGYQNNYFGVNIDVFSLNLGVLFDGKFNWDLDFFDLIDISVYTNYP